MSCRTLALAGVRIPQKQRDEHARELREAEKTTSAAGTGAAAYGTQAVSCDEDSDQEDRIDPMIYVFPR